MASSVDNNSQNVTSTRDQYDKRENELKRQQADEIKKIRKQYNDRIRSIQEKHQEELESVRANGNERLSEKDMKYQKEIDKIKQAQQSQQINTAQNYDRQLRQVQDQHEGEITKTNEQHKSQLDNMNANYEKDVKQKGEQYSKDVTDLREKEAQSIAAQRERLEAAHEKNQGSLRKTQDEKIDELTSQLSNARKTKNARIKDLELQSMTDREEDSKNLDQSVRQVRQRNEMEKNNMRDNFNKNLTDLRKKYYESNLDAKSGKAADIQRNVDFTEAQEKKAVGSLNRKLQETRAKNDNDSFLMQQNFAQEKRDYMNENKNALQSAEELRNQVYDATNKRTSQQIKDMSHRNDQLLTNQRKYYQGEIQQKDDKYKESIDTQVKSLEIDNQKDKKRADDRQQKINFITTRDKQELEGYYKDILAARDQSHQDEMIRQRNSMLKERNDAINSLQQRMRETDFRNGEKMTLQSQRYEKQISDLKEQFKIEKKQMHDAYNKRLDELQKDTKLEVDTEKSQSMNRENQLKERYEKQIGQLQSSQEQEKIRLALNK